jgi:ketosteroid isomerase-like protein
MHPEYADRILATTRPVATHAANDPQAVLHAAYEAVIRGDFDVFGTWRGRNEVVAATRRNFAEVEHQQPTIEGMICQGDRIAVLLRESGMLKSIGKAYSIRGVQWFTFASGKIAKIDEIVASVWKVDA